MRRRDFIGGILTSALVPAIGGCRSALVGDRVRLACVGIGQQAWYGLIGVRPQCIGWSA